MKEKVLQRIIDLFRVLPFICILFIVIEVQKMVDHKLEYAALRKTVEQDVSENDKNGQNVKDQNTKDGNIKDENAKDGNAKEQTLNEQNTRKETTVTQQDGKNQAGTKGTKILPKFESLYEENEDLVGWIRIPDNNINYPIVQGTNDNFYLSHNFYKEEDKYGCLFIKGEADSGFDDQNTVIYAHNMRDNEMFGSLDRYRRQEYEKNHSTIYLDTLYEERKYEIIAVCESKVMEKEDTSFKYYQFMNAESEQEFQAFMSFIKECELYQIEEKDDLEMTYDLTQKDSFLMLSTCAYEEENGRLVVIAKRIQS